MIVIAAHPQLTPVRALISGFEGAVLSIFVADFFRKSPAAFSPAAANLFRYLAFGFLRLCLIDLLGRCLLQAVRLAWSPSRCVVLQCGAVWLRARVQQPNCAVREGRKEVWEEGCPETQKRQSVGFFTR